MTAIAESEAVLGACLTNRLGIEWPATSTTLSSNKLLSSRYGHRALESLRLSRWRSSACARANTDADRASSLLDGRQADELRLLAAMAQATGSCGDGCTPSEGPTITWSTITWSTVLRV